MICKALRGGAGVGLTSDVSSCITWAHAQGAKVISMSLGGGASTTLQQAVQGAWENGGASGSVLVAAAGNDGDSTVNYPAGYAEVVSVAATDQNDAKASFSNTNADVEVAAPGVNILSTIPGGQYATMSGTSMATPHASGVTGVLWQLFPTATASEHPQPPGRGGGRPRRRGPRPVLRLRPGQPVQGGRRRRCRAARPRARPRRSVLIPPPSRHHPGAGRLHR